MSTQPILSILIPTKNRLEYCIRSIQTILKYDYDFFELVIQDNSETNLLQEKINHLFKDTRLKYFYCGEPLSFVDNFSTAVENTSGEYICLIGDDDGVCDDLFATVKWAKEKNIDSVCPKVFVNYLWPGNNNVGKMVIPYFTNKIWINKPKNNLQKLVNQGIVNYMYFNLPKLYHGIIKRTCMDEIKLKTGQYFGGLTPDIYSSVALSCIVQKHVVIDRPITIAGACPKSATVDSTKGRHSGSLDNAPHFRNRGEYIWDESVPKFYSVQTIWAESAIQAMKDFNVEIDLKKLDISKILATSIIAAPNYKSFFTTESYKKISKNKLNFKIKTDYYILKEFFIGNLKRVYYRIPRKFILRQIRKTDVKDIFEAMVISNKELKRTNINKILNAFNGQSRII